MNIRELREALDRLDVGEDQEVYVDAILPGERAWRPRLAELLNNKRGMRHPDP